MGYLDQYADIPDGMKLIDFLHTAFQDLYDKNARMTQLYTDYAETADDKLLGELAEFKKNWKPTALRY